MERVESSYHVQREIVKRTGQARRDEKLAETERLRRELENSKLMAEMSFLQAKHIIRMELMAEHEERMNQLTEEVEKECERRDFHNHVQWYESYEGNYPSDSGSYFYSDEEAMNGEFHSPSAWVVSPFSQTSPPPPESELPYSTLPDTRSPPGSHTALQPVSEELVPETPHSSQPSSGPVNSLPRPPVTTASPASIGSSIGSSIGTCGLGYFDDNGHIASRLNGDSPLRAEAFQLAKVPRAEDPRAEDPLAEDPRAEDPRAEDPLAQDQKSTQPVTPHGLAAWYIHCAERLRGV